MPVAGLALSQNAPNPFNPETVIEYTVDAAGPVAIVVYDARGRRVRSEAFTLDEPGSYRWTWDGLDAEGRPAASGAYFYAVRTERGARSAKMVLVR